MTYRAEFDRRVRAALVPKHAEHDTAALSVEWSGSEGDDCPTCGYDSRAEVIVKGVCGCGQSVYCDRSLTSADLGEFMRQITAD